VLIVLELAILGLLKEQELHGYELKKRLSERVGLASGASFGSLYPALARLEHAGAVRAVLAGGSSTASIPLTGSLGGELAAFRARISPARGARGKKVYGITGRGEQLFGELLAAEHGSSDNDRVFNLRLAFAAYLPADARLTMLERRRSQLSDRVVHLAARLKVGRDRLDGYGASLAEHDREAAEHDLSWVDQLIASERQGPPAPPATPGPSPATSQEDTTP